MRSGNPSSSQFPKRPFALQPRRLARERPACLCRNSLNGLSLFNGFRSASTAFPTTSGRNSLNGLSLFNSASPQLPSGCGNNSRNSLNGLSLFNNISPVAEGGQLDRSRNSLNGLSLFNLFIRKLSLDDVDEIRSQFPKRPFALQQKR